MLKRNLVCNGIALFTLAATAFISAVASVAAGVSPTAIPNFHVVDPGIYRGAVPTPEGLQELKALGVKTVIDLRISPKHVKAEGVEVRALGMNFINLPMGSDPPTHKEVAALMAALNQASTTPVFVHCQYGADRTGCMIGLWRVTHDGWSYARAYAEMRKYGFKRYLGSMAAAVHAAAKS